MIASDESISLDYNYYLPRVDRIYLSKDGVLTIKKGAPADNPSPPDEVSGAMNLANVYLPAYLYSPKSAKVTFIQHKRYQMSDIAKIEQRVKNLEYYTSLNQLESATINQFVPDANGLNRFKSGVLLITSQVLKLKILVLVSEIVLIERTRFLDLHTSLQLLIWNLVIPQLLVLVQLTHLIRMLDLLIFLVPM